MFGATPTHLGAESCPPLPPSGVLGPHFVHRPQHRGTSLAVHTLSPTHDRFDVHDQHFISHYSPFLMWESSCDLFSPFSFSASIRLARRTANNGYTYVLCRDTADRTTLVLAYMYTYDDCYGVLFVFNKRFTGCGFEYVTK